MARKIYISGKQLAVTQGKTTFLQNQQGLMMGRKVPAGNAQGDSTRNLRAKQDIEIDGKPGIGAGDVRGGQILGRMKANESKPTRVEVTAYYRKGDHIRHHFRKIHPKSK